MAVREGWRGRFYEDFEIGDVYEHPLGRTVTTTDNLWFTLLTQNTAPVLFLYHEHGARRRGNGMSMNKRGRVRATHEWELLVPLFEWSEQERYEEIRAFVLFDVSVAERAEEVGTSASTL